MKNLRQILASVLFITLGILAAGFGLKGFLLPSRFIDGGVTGISMLIAALSPVPLSLLIALINVPFIIIGFRHVSKSFAIKTALAIGGLALALIFVPYPTVTNDKLLTAVFGGAFLGAGIGLSIRGGSVLDGTEVLALILSKKLGATLGDIVLVMNIFIFSVAAFFLGVETALYSILTFFSVSKTIDFVIHGIEEYNGIVIISDRSEEIKTALLNDLGRGVTVYRGYGGMSQDDKNILFCVVTRLEIPKVKGLVTAIDETAFTVIHHITDASGGVLKRRALH